MIAQRLIHLPQRIWKKLHSQTLILLYHRVANLETDPQLLSVSPGHFAEHLEYISDHYTPISLAELNRAIEEKKIPDKSVVITFDDGYADNFLNAKPLLEKYDIPATVFVASGYVGSEREFWWDELERLLLRPKNLPDKLELNINGKIQRWDIDGIPGSQEVSEFDLNMWDVTMDLNPRPEYQAYRDLHRLMKPLSHEEQQHVLDELARWVGMSREGRSTHLALGCDQLKKLEQERGLIEVGAHTVNHPMLSAQSPEVQAKEIIENKKYLENILDHEVHTFSYPFGGKPDFTSYTMNIIRENGFDLACANYSGSVISRTNPYKLPRYLVRNWDVNQFSHKIREWFDE